jgi:hypothetical protein
MFDRLAFTGVVNGEQMENLMFASLGCPQSTCHNDMSYDIKLGLLATDALRELATDINAGDSGPSALLEKTSHYCAAVRKAEVIHRLRDADNATDAMLAALGKGDLGRLQVRPPSAELLDRMEAIVQAVRRDNRRPTEDEMTELARAFLVLSGT